MQAARWSRAARRTAPRSTRRGRSRARAADRAARASSRLAAAGRARRCRGSRSSAASARSRSRRARCELVERARPRPSPAARARRRTRRPAGWPRRRRARARRAAPGRRSARPRAAGTRPPRRGRRAPAPGRPSARARAATSSSGPAAAAARCHARRSGSASRSVASASARCDRPALVGAGRPVHRRAHQRMTEGHALADRRAARPLGAPSRRPAIPSRSAARQQQQRIADRLGRRDQQQTPRVVGERARAGGRSSPRSAPRAPCGAEHPEPAGQLRRGQPSRQLEQRQRVAPRLGDDPVADPLVQHEPHRRAQQRAGVAVAQAAHLQLGQRARSSSPGSRAANTIPTGSASRRRATKASVSADA